MKYFFKLNFFGILYALFIFIQTEHILNMYRLERITHWLDGTTNIILYFVIFIIFTIFFIIITTRYFNAGKLRYFLTILWVPYYIILTSLFATLNPITISW